MACFVVNKRENRRDEEIIPRARIRHLKHEISRCPYDGVSPRRMRGKDRISKARTNLSVSPFPFYENC